MSSPIRTTVEARIAHVVGILLGVGIAVAGFLANHRGVQIPCTGLTVGGAIAGVSHFRYFRVLERTVDSAVAWEKENKNILEALRFNLSPIIRRLIPANLATRIENVEGHLSDIVTAAAPATVDEEAIANRVLAKLAMANSQQKAPATNGPVPVQGDSSTAPVAPASSFQDPPVVPATT